MICVNFRSSRALPIITNAEEAGFVGISSPGGKILSGYLQRPSDFSWHRL
jgi:hypothetical protein